MLCLLLICLWVRRFRKVFPGRFEKYVKDCSGGETWVCAGYISEVLIQAVCFVALISSSGMHSARMSLEDYGAILSARNPNVCFCCLEPWAHQLSCFLALLDVTQRIPVLAEPELTLTCGELSVLWSFTMLLLQAVKSLKASVSMVAKCTGIQDWVWSLIHKNQGSSFSVRHRCCLLLYKIGLLVLPEPCLFPSSIIPQAWL